MRLLITITFSCLVAFCQTAPRLIHGVAIDAATQKPIPDAWVNAGAEIVKTDIKGEFQLILRRRPLTCAPAATTA